MDNYNQTFDRGIGEYFRKLREEKSLTIEEVANKLRLKKEYIKNIEENNYPPVHPIYVKGYIRSYARLLAISDEDVTKTLNTISLEHPLFNVKRTSFTARQVSASDKFMQWITFSIITILIAMVMLWWRSDKLSSGTVALSDTQVEDPIYSMLDKK